MYTSDLEETIQASTLAGHVGASCQEQDTGIKK